MSEHIGWPLNIEYLLQMMKSKEVTFEVKKENIYLIHDIMCHHGEK